MRSASLAHEKAASSEGGSLQFKLVSISRFYCREDILMYFNVINSDVATDLRYQGVVLTSLIALIALTTLTTSTHVSMFFPR